MEGKISYWIQQGSAGCWMVIILVGHDLLMSSRGPIDCVFLLEGGMGFKTVFRNGVVSKVDVWQIILLQLDYIRRWFTGYCCRTNQIITIFFSLYFPTSSRVGGWGPSPPLRGSDVADSCEVFTSRRAEHSKCANAMKTKLIPSVKVIGIAFALCIEF